MNGTGYLKLLRILFSFEKSHKRWLLLGLDWTFYPFYNNNNHIFKHILHYGLISDTSIPSKKFESNSKPFNEWFCLWQNTFQSFNNNNSNNNTMHNHGVMLFWVRMIMKCSMKTEPNHIWIQIHFCISNSLLFTQNWIITHYFGLKKEIFRWILAKSRA